MIESPATTRRFVIVLGLLTSLIAIAIDISLPAIPDMVADMNSTMSLGQQIVGWFVAGAAVGQLPFGLISDRVGRLPVLFFGIGLFTLAGFVTAASESMQVMLTARFFQGLGCAAGMVLARAIVRDVSSGDDAARLMSLMVMIFTAAPMIAPLIGSMMVPLWGWQAPFLVTAVTGVIMLWLMRTSLGETLRPSAPQHWRVQLRASVRTFFGNRKCVFGLLIAVSTLIGVMAIVSGSSALIIEIYGVEVKNFGFYFALTGVAILAGSSVNRRLLKRFSTLTMIGVGASLAAFAGIVLFFLASLEQPPFWWVWSAVCLFMVATAFLSSNATVFALDPVPEIAGVAASLIGTLQMVFGALSGIVSSALYVGTIANTAIVIGVAGVLVLVIFLARGVIIGPPTT